MQPHRLGKSEKIEHGGTYAHTYVVFSGHYGFVLLRANAKLISRPEGLFYPSFPSFPSFASTSDSFPALKRTVRFSMRHLSLSLFLFLLLLDFPLVFSLRSCFFPLFDVKSFMSTIFYFVKFRGVRFFLPLAVRREKESENRFRVALRVSSRCRRR